MRRDELQRLRSRAGVAIVVGLLGGLVLAGLGLFWGAASGMGMMGCGGSSGCEQRAEEDGANANRLIYLALFGGGGLIVAGVVTRIVTGKRLRALQPAPLPVATVVERPDIGRDLP